MALGVLDRVGGKTGALIIVGSGLHWSWFDALFMSSFFRMGSPVALMPEIATILVFACCIPFCLWILRHKDQCQKLLINGRTVVVFSLLGTIGSLLFVAASLAESYCLLVLGGIGAGAYMAFSQMGWCAAYAHQGAKSATPSVSGAFASAILFDAVALSMLPAISVLLFASLPLLSGMAFLTMDPAWRSYRTLRAAPSEAPLQKGRLMAVLRGHLGFSLTLLSALTIVFVCFGYIQHMVSFGGAPGSTPTDGVLIQVMRGLVAVLLFVSLVFTQVKQGIVYRVGLLLMIAGCLVMPFSLGTEHFWFCGALIIAGFTAFDILIYVVFSEVAYADSESPIKTIALMRIFTCMGYCVGAVCAILLGGVGEKPGPYFMPEATLVGYLMTIATVLMLSGEDFWLVLGIGAYRVQATPQQPGNMLETFDRKLDCYNLTARELEIARHIALGRTQSWIARELGISENTVGTPVRHIYP